MTRKCLVEPKSGGGRWLADKSTPASGEPERTAKMMDFRSCFRLTQGMKLPAARAPHHSCSSANSFAKVRRRALNALTCNPA